MDDRVISFIQPSRNNLKYLKWSYNSIRTHLDPKHQICWADDYSDDGKWEKFRLKYKELWGDSILQPRFKRDHGIQKRLQVGITHKNLKKHFNLD